MPVKQEEPVGLIKGLRGAIDESELENVLRAAGARELKGQATEVLRETSAASAGPILSRNQVEALRRAPQPSGKLVDAAERAIDEVKVRSAAERAGLKADDAMDATSRQVARIAQAATDYARSEGRPVCHNCVGIGAARAAEQLGPLTLS